VPQSVYNYAHPVIIPVSFYRAVLSARIPGLLFYDLLTKQLFGLVLFCLLFKIIQACKAGAKVNLKIRQTLLWINIFKKLILGD